MEIKCSVIFMFEGRKVLKKLPLCHLESHLEEVCIFSINSLVNVCVWRLKFSIPSKMVEGLGSINLQKHCQDDASNLVPPKSGEIS